MSERRKATARRTAARAGKSAGRRAVDQTATTGAASEDATGRQLIYSVIIAAIPTGGIAAGIPTINRVLGDVLPPLYAAAVLCGVFTVVAGVAFLVLRHLEDVRLRRAAEEAAIRAHEARRNARTHSLKDALEHRLARLDALFAEPASRAKPQPKAAPPRARGDVPFELELEQSAPEGTSPDAPKPKAALDPRLTGFASSAWDVAQSAVLDLDPHDAFAMQLFIAGGCSEFLRRSPPSAERPERILSELLRKLGTSETYANGFAANANAFAQIPAFRPPIDAGREAMTAKLDLGQDNPSGIPGLLAGWSALRDQIVAPEFDTLIAIELAARPVGDGDAAPDGLRGLVRSFKALIDPTITRGGGARCIETDQGIAVRFADTEMAVRTAIALQEQTAAWARGWDKYVVELRVAADVAFGPVVDGAFVSVELGRLAKLLEATQPGEIVCTENVQSRALNGRAFQPHAGADGLPPLFALPWAAESPEAARTKDPLEYRQIGGVGDESLVASRKVDAVDAWLAKSGLKS